MEDKKANPFKGLLILIVIACVGLSVPITRGIKHLRQAEAERDMDLYAVSVSNVVDVMKETVLYLDYVDTLQAKVWYNAIHEERDADTDAFTATVKVEETYLGPLKRYEFF